MLKANQEVLKRMSECDPVLVDIRLAKDVLKDFKKNIFLHAGPPIEFERMCEPMKGAVYCALLNEGLAKDIEEAKKVAVSGEIIYKPCHEFGVVGPMTGLTTWSIFFRLSTISLAMASSSIIDCSFAAINIF